MAAGEINGNCLNYPTNVITIFIVDVVGSCWGNLHLWLVNEVVNPWWEVKITFRHVP